MNLFIAILHAFARFFSEVFSAIGLIVEKITTNGQIFVSFCLSVAVLLRLLSWNPKKKEG